MRAGLGRSCSSCSAASYFIESGLLEKARETETEKKDRNKERDKRDRSKQIATRYLSMLRSLNDSIQVMLGGASVKAPVGRQR
jgi:hypothetical protein